jgi:hypothetical protein
MSDTKSEYLRKLLGSAPYSRDYSSGLDKDAISGLGSHLIEVEPFLWTRPTGEMELITVASITNDWFVTSYKEHRRDSIQEKLEKAANLIGEVAAVSAKNNVHFSKIREAGRLLVAASVLL